VYGSTENPSGPEPSGIGRSPERRYLSQPAGQTEAGRENQLRPPSAEDANDVVDRPLPGAQAADGDREHGKRQDVLVALAGPEDKEAVAPVRGDERDRHHADRRRIAKPTLYHYFRSKDEILRGIHESFIGTLLERQDERVRLGLAPADLLLAPADLLLGAMTDIFGLMETHRGYVRVFFEHHRELPDEARREIRVKRDRYERLIRDAVDQGIRVGAFRDVDPNAATMAVFGICNWAYQWWRPGGGADPALMAQKMWDLVIRGLVGGSSEGAENHGQRPR
jgi:AcrR family transcriptional regulator